LGYVRHTNTDNGAYNDALHSYLPMTVDINMCLHWTVFFKKKVCSVSHSAAYVIHRIWNITLNNVACSILGGQSNRFISCLSRPWFY